MARITIQESLNQLIGAVFGGIGPIIGMGVGAFHLVGPAVVAIIPAWLGLTCLTARTVYGRITKKRARELEDLANRLAALAGELVDVHS
ncbi:MAG: hypothetical protein AUH75_07820 [Gemmatimonadetes bacterium 13_1_40CM_4_65_7]|nr:MAG: hypothetical protein AUH75_07820 [Gemmatimonadetes bacterium 13_1_40CM_4_65_7]